MANILRKEFLEKWLLKFFESTRFMPYSLSNIVENLVEDINEIYINIVQTNL